GDDEFAFYSIDLDPHLLVEGDNVVAVEVHQLSGSSSDLSFALELLVLTNTTAPLGNTLILPPSVAPIAGGYGAGTLRAANLRLQEVYGAANFPPNFAFWITELRFRPDASLGSAFNTTVGNIQVNLSTTPRAPGALSLTYANNTGADDLVVFSGALPLSSQFSGPAGGPKNFDIVIPLTTAFLYDPGAGNLLLDVRNFSGSSASPLSGQNSSSDSASRIAGSTASPTASGADSGIDALQIVYTTTNPPPRPPPPTVLLRGPYLQRATMTNILVCWRTSAMTNGIVKFGLTADALSWQVQSATITNNQYVALTNLAPNTKYFYSVGATDTNLASGPTYFFVTFPAGAKPTRIWALGDFGTAGQGGDTAPAVRDAYYNFAGTRHTDVWLMLGDNAYSYGLDDEYQRAVFERFPEMLQKTVAWSTIGNHETYGSNAVGHIAYYDIFQAPKAAEAGGVASGNLHYYSFNYGNIHFVCLDSELSSLLPTGAMAAWLHEDLSSNTNEWLIAFWHSPPYTKGSHDSDQDADTDGHLKKMREVFLPILESYGVDLVLGGHSHNYERSYLLDGHYGKSGTLQPYMIKNSGSGQVEGAGAYMKASSGPDANQGAVYVVAGSGGFATFQNGHHPAMYSALLRTGSLVLDVDGSRLDGMFLRETGAIDDHFTILKGTNPGPVHFSRIDIIRGAITAMFKTVAGKTYRIESSINLETPDWNDVSGPIIAIGPTTTWTGPAAADGGKRFFRVLQTN
ncbi:MAG: acid phosphatase type 7, partial [Verrucomicrobiota bacterium]